MISIVMPVYNSEKYLEIAIKSILNQTYSKFEFLILDDFSTDNSVSIINRYKKLDSRIKVFYFKKKIGLVKLLNFSLNKVKFKYLARMDSDDIAEKNRLKIQLNYLLKNERVGVVGSFVRIIDHNGLTKKYWKYPVRNVDIKKHLNYECCLAHPATMMKVELVKKVGGYREITELVEDYDLWTRLSCICEIENIPEFLLDYRQHSESSSSIKKAEQLLKREFIKTNYKYLKKNIDLISLNHIKILNKKTISRILENSFSPEFFFNSININSKNSKIQYLISIFIFFLVNPLFILQKLIFFLKRKFYY
jgi:glycosyltransferase involved in cell wall biosynthesis